MTKQQIADALIEIGFSFDETTKCYVKKGFDDLFCTPGVPYAIRVYFSDSDVLYLEFFGSINNMFRVVNTKCYEFEELSFEEGSIFSTVKTNIFKSR